MTFVPKPITPNRLCCTFYLKLQALYTSHFHLLNACTDPGVTRCADTDGFCAPRPSVQWRAGGGADAVGRPHRCPLPAWSRP